jgi:phage terminase large subunit-like protein
MDMILAEERRRARNKIDRYFLAEGDRRRELYPKQIEFFEAGARYKERLFMAANRVGKSQAGAFETTCHLTGIYPDWWTGRRFPKRNEGWACGTNNETTRNIVQIELLGALDALGTGMIPGDLIVHVSRRQNGLQGSIEGAWIKHASGGTSHVAFKTYEQGRKSFEGTGKDWIWWDEEPPLDIYTEGLYRTITTQGIMLTTFTPLQGMSDVVKSFVEPEEAARAYKWFVQAGWKDVPHLDENEKRVLLATTPAYQIAARTEGEPSLGAGAIYPLPESDVRVDPFPVPPTWPRVFALDVGWRRTAALWMARNPENAQLFFYDEHYQSQGEPASHAAAIKARGDWIAGVIDPAARGRSVIDGRELLQMYYDLGLNLAPAANAVEAGILEVWQLLVSGQLKVMANCQNWFSEFRKYHRDEQGRIVKKDDHLMDACRYLIASARPLMTTKPVARPAHDAGGAPRGGSWMS